MTSSGRSVPTAHFDALYERSSDPWRFETSDYERQKYARTIAALGGRRFKSGFELGCSIGVLTARLAERCDKLLAGDCSEAAIALARRRPMPNDAVVFRTMRAPDDLPDGEFDLIVLSEVLYFLSHDDLRAVAAYCGNSLETDGLLLLVNYLGPTDTALSGDEAADAFIEATSGHARIVEQQRDTHFRLDLLARTCPAQRGV